MATVSVTHRKVVTIPDDPNYPVGSGEWNDSHVIAGLENVDNTSDVNKPVSTAQAAAIAASVGGAWTNARTAKTAAYTVVNTDAGSTIALGGAAFYTLTINAASGYNSNFVVMIENEDTRGKLIAINGYTSFILWPKQSFLLFNQNNVWQFDSPGRWRLATSQAWNVDHVNGSDSSDGLAIGAGAFSTINHGLAVIQGQVDPNNFAVALQLATETFTENVAVLGPTAFGASLSISIIGNASSPSSVVWQTTGIALTVRDQAVIILAGIKFVGLGSSQTAISVSQNSTVDFSNMEFGTFAGGTHINVVGNGQVNYNHGSYTVSGNFSQHIANQGPGTIIIANCTVSVPNALTFSSWYFGSGNSFFETASTTFTGTGAGSGSTGSQYIVTEGASALLNGVTLPGSFGGFLSNGGSVDAVTSTLVLPSTASAHTFATAVSAAGAVTYTQPTAADVSGLGTADHVQFGTLGLGGAAASTTIPLTISGTTITDTNQGTAVGSMNGTLAYASTSNLSMFGTQSTVTVTGASAGSNISAFANFYQLSIGLSGATLATAYNFRIRSGTTGAAPTGTVSGLAGVAVEAPGLFHTGTPTLTFTATYGLRVANQAMAVTGITQGTVYGLWVDTQTNGTSNYLAWFNGTNPVAVQNTGLGYVTGAGGTVTQATSKATGVTLSKASGAITMNNAALAAGTIVSFVLTNTAIAATDVLILNHISGGTVGSYSLNAQCAAGSATINVRNNTAGSLSEAIVIQFALIKAVNA